MSILRTNQITNTAGNASPNIPGGILQVKQTVKTDVFGTTTNGFVDITGLTVSITPQSTSSKVMVEVHIGTQDANAASGIMYKLRRGSTDIGLGTDPSNQNFCTFAATINADRGEGISMKLLDNPQTTSAITYGVQIHGFGNNVDINKRSNLYSTISTITVMEIGG